MVGDSAASEPKKLVFVKKMENVPIKKRRLLLQSPSPPHQAPSYNHEDTLSPQVQSQYPHSEVSKQLLDCKHDLHYSDSFSNWKDVASDGYTALNCASSVDDRVMSGKISAVTGGSLCYTDGATGIALLAAAAYSGNICDNADNAKDKPVVEEATNLKGLELSASSFPSKGLVHEDNTDILCAQDGSFSVSQSLHNKDDGCVAKKSVSSKNDRLHWDLNTLMEEWEQHCDDLTNGFQTNMPDFHQNAIDKDKLENVEIHETHKVSEHTQCGLEYRVQSTVCTMVSPKSKDLTISGASLRNSQMIEIGDEKRQDGEASVSETVDNHSWVDSGTENLESKHFKLSVSTEEAAAASVPQKSCRSYTENPDADKVSSSLDECYNSNVSQEDRDNIIGVENRIALLQAGYDSPFEDGELRESVMFSWKENDGEYEETECVDYESNNGDDFDVADYPTPEKVEGCFEDGQIVEKRRSLTGKAMEADFNESESVKTLNSEVRRLVTRNDDSGKIEMIRKKGLNIGSSLLVKQSAAVSMEGNGIASKSNSSDHIDELDEDSHAREFGTRVSWVKLLSCFQGPSSLDILHAEDSVLAGRSRCHNFGGSYSRAERTCNCDNSLGSDQSCSHLHQRNGWDGHQVDCSMGHWGSRDRYATRYRFSEDYDGYTRPRSVTSDYAAKAGRFDCHDYRQSINYSTKSVYRSLARRRSPVDRDDCYSLRRGITSVKDISHDRSRGRSKIYRPRVGRGPREEYQELVHDDATASPISLRNYLTKRKRSFSPSFTRSAHTSRLHRRSRSRSRTRSPPAWNLRREQNMVKRRHSRSPEFRSKARMDRMRLPFRKHRFASDHEESFMNHQRNRLPLGRNLRWIDDQNCMDDCFKDRKSPVRMARQIRRYDFVSCDERLKSEDDHGPMIYPGKFLVLEGADGAGGCTYEDSDDDKRKNDDNRYEAFDQVRRYGSGGGVVRRFPYDLEYYYKAYKSHSEDECTKGTDQKNVANIAREESDPLRCNNDGIGTSSLVLGLQDCEGDASPGRG